MAKTPLHSEERPAAANLEEPSRRMRKLLQEIRKIVAADSTGMFTERQKKVIELHAQGLNPNRIAAEVGISRNAVVATINALPKKVSRIARFSPTTGSKKLAEFKNNLDRKDLDIYLGVKHIDPVTGEELTRPYRRAPERPHPNLDAMAEKNRTKHKITLRFEEALIREVDQAVEAQRAEGTRVDRNQWITEAIQMRLKMNFN